MMVTVAQAHRVGANGWSRDNPVVSLWAGPRVLLSGDVIADVTLGLSVPLELSRSRVERVRLADTLSRQADFDLQIAQQNAVFEALELWLAALCATLRMQAEQGRVTLEQNVLRIALSHRSNGATGDAELALATLTLATAQARLSALAGDRNAALAQLRVLLQLNETPSVSPSELGPRPVAPLEELVARLDRRPDVLRAVQAIEHARVDSALQHALAFPVPRLGLAGGRENELYARVGLDVSLPVFQRNQTAIAVTEQTVALRRTEAEQARLRAEAEVRAAYARHLAALTVLSQLNAAAGAIDDSERFATRAYELGERDLLATTVVYREVAAARAAVLEARIAVATTQLALDRATGAVTP
jgi:cobalt-zinc-cadmium efflux system outer membrane protein